MISGMGELHLEVIVDRMKREFNVEAGVGRPQVAYRETVRGEATKVEGKFIRQTGGSGQYGVVYINMEPAPGEGFDFVNKIKGGSVPSEFIPAVEKGIEEALESGVKAGFPMVDVRVTLTDGKYHDTDSSEIAFKVAGSMAAKEAPRRAKPVLLEPIMAVEVITPDDFLGTVIGDLSEPPRAGGGAGAARQCDRRPGERAAVLDVRLRDRPALQHAGTGELLDAVRPLRRGPRQHRRGDRRAPNRRAGRSRRISEYVSEVRLRPAREAGLKEFRKEQSQWRRRSSSATSRTATSAPSVTSTTARPR